MANEQWALFVGIAFKGVAAVMFLWIAKRIASRLIRWIPEGRFKRLLLVRLNKSGN